MIFFFQTFSSLLEGPHSEVSDRVQYKNKLKILIIQDCLNLNSHVEYVGPWWRDPKNINIYYEDVCIDWAVKWFKVIYTIPIIELHSKEHPYSLNENWKQWFWFIKLLHAAARYWTKAEKANIALWRCCLAVKKKDQKWIFQHDKKTPDSQVWPHVTWKTGELRITGALRITLFHITFSSFPVTFLFSLHSYVFSRCEQLLMAKRDGLCM